MRYFYMFLGPLYFKIYSIKHIEMFSKIISLALNTAHTCEFKQMWYQVLKADYCFKHFKLVFILNVHLCEYYFPLKY